MRQARGSFDENENVLIITEMIDRLDEKKNIASSRPCVPSSCLYFAP